MGVIHTGRVRGAEREESDSKGNQKGREESDSQGEGGE